MQNCWTIGSRPECDIVVDEPTVSGKHCQLLYEGGFWKIEDLKSTNGTWVDGVRIEATRDVARGDEIRLGQSVILDWEQIPVRSWQVKIGRATNNDVVFKESDVSAHHALIRVEQDALILEDLGTSNGTFVGNSNERIDSQTVTARDRVRFGSCKAEINQILQHAAAKNPEVAAWLASHPSTSPPTWIPGKRFAIVSALVACLVIGFLFVRYFPGMDDDPGNVARNSGKNDSPDASLTNSAETKSQQNGNSGTDSSQPADSEKQDTPSAKKLADESETVPRSSTDTKVTSPKRIGSADGIYSVVVRSESDGLAFQVGTAWALSDEWLVTSAEVIHAMEQSSEDSVFEVYWEPGDRMEITQTIAHPAYRTAESATNAAFEKYKAMLESQANESTAIDESEFAKRVTDLNQQFRDAASRLAYFDIGLLRVDLPEYSRLHKIMTLSQVPVNRIKGRDMKLTGHSCPLTGDIEFDPDNISASGFGGEILTSTVSSRGNSGVSAPDAYLVHVECPASEFKELHTKNWMGSPVFDKQGQVVGVFSRVVTPDQGSPDDQPDAVSDQERRVFLMTIVDRLVEFPQLEELLTDP